VVSTPPRNCQADLVGDVPARIELEAPHPVAGQLKIVAQQRPHQEAVVGRSQTVHFVVFHVVALGHVLGGEPQAEVFVGQEVRVQLGSEHLHVGVGIVEVVGSEVP
jgi:hypothetical protein